MPENRLGLLLVVSAPSGTGKSTLIRRLCKEFPRLAFSVSYTTRSPRAGEVDGREYHFVSQEEFSRLQEQGLLAEWAEVHGQRYGTPRTAVLELLSKGRDVLFDIDVQGARQLREAFEQGVFVFLLPPSRQVLEQRLKGRGSETPESLARRLGNAKMEIVTADFFEYQVVNDQLEQAYQELRAVYLAEAARRCRNPGLHGAILATWG